MTPEQIKKARNKMGITQKEMAARLDITKSGYEKYEQGTRNLSGTAKLMFEIITHYSPAIKLQQWLNKF